MGSWQRQVMLTCGKPRCLPCHPLFEQIPKSCIPRGLRARERSQAGPHGPLHCVFASRPSVQSRLDSGPDPVSTQHLSQLPHLRASPYLPQLPRHPGLGYSSSFWRSGSGSPWKKPLAELRKEHHDVLVATRESRQPTKLKTERESAGSGPMTPSYSVV